MGFFEIGSCNYFPWLASNHDSPDLCLLIRESGVSHRYLATCIFNMERMGWGYRSVVEHLPSMYEALGFDPQDGRKKKPMETA
jgi:hypothetical protein